MTQKHRFSNKLNDLTNRQWLQETKSFWLSAADNGSAWTAEDMADLTRWLIETRGEERAEAMLEQAFGSLMWSVAPPRDAVKIQHPATFSERDIERLIELFTKSGETVLDPFVGSGSTLVACRDTGRQGIGIELVPRWAQAARERLAAREGDGQKPAGEVLEGDAAEQLAAMSAKSVDFVVTSPPYWSILGKKGMKVRAERQARKLPTQYSDDARDLGNIENYEELLDRLAENFAGCGRVLATRRYMAVIVSDFRHGPQFYLFHADLARRIEDKGLPLKGITILLQDNKNLYPFGVPNAFVSNIHHQYILIHQKPR